MSEMGTENTDNQKPETEHANTRPLYGYLWGGPSFARMLATKYGSTTNVDFASIMNSYDSEYLEKVSRLGINRVFASLFWGYRDESAQLDFLTKRADNFHKQGIEIYAYVQGPNLVRNDFVDKDWWAKGPRGQHYVYFRGRDNTCVNNPGYTEFFLDRIHKALQTGVSGIFIDNLVQGQLNSPAHCEFINNACFCEHCQSLFRQRYGKPIPANFHTLPQAEKEEVFQFRTDSILDFLSQTRSVIDANGRAVRLGFNCFDPQYDQRKWLGIDLEAINQSGLCDFVLFEHHAFPFHHGRNPVYIEDKARTLSNLETISLPYIEGIGSDPQFSPYQLAALLEYSRQAQTVSTCIKLTEFKTAGVWHNLYLNELNSSNNGFDFGDYRQAQYSNPPELIKILAKIPGYRYIVRHHYANLVRWFFENNFMSEEFRQQIYRLLAK